MPNREIRIRWSDDNADIPNDAAILRAIAERVYDGYRSGVVRDDNGNVIGEWVSL